MLLRASLLPLPLVRRLRLYVFDLRIFKTSILAPASSNRGRGRGRSTTAAIVVLPLVLALSLLAFRLVMSI